jgi:hypothetical protein
MIGREFNMYDLEDVAILNFGTHEEFEQTFRRRTKTPHDPKTPLRGLLKEVKKDVSQADSQEPHE